MQPIMLASLSLSNPIITSPQQVITGTLLAPDAVVISFSASASFVTSNSLNGTFSLERNSFAVLQKGHVGVEYTLITSSSDIRGHPLVFLLL
jgi:hypothetical protein